MKVLVACEESQEVCKAFREKGHEAYSCDIQECSGGHPEWHIIGDCIPLLNGNCSFITEGGAWVVIDSKWDLLIAHPPCTYLTVSGNAWFNVEKYGKKAEQRWKDRVEAAVFFMKFVAADCEHIAIENPVGIRGTVFRKADQIIQPYEYGHPTKKTTCLWLKGLPKLTPTEIVNPEMEEYLYSNGQIKKYGKGIGEAVKDGKILAWNDPLTKKIRSKTFTGIAKAFAEQWNERSIS